MPKLQKIKKIKKAKISSKKQNICKFSNEYIDLDRFQR
jgi:hypothetical protein